MSFLLDLKNVLEEEERRTVGSSFGGNYGSASFSVVSVRNWIADNYQGRQYQGEFSTDILKALKERVEPIIFRSIIASAVRYAFLIELTDLKVGSTKMKTRWFPGLILMPQHNSFEPIRGEFSPGNDPRASGYEACCLAFERVIGLTLENLTEDASLTDFLARLQRYTRVPYEYPIGYLDPSLEPVHQADNIQWLKNDDIAWLLASRRILRTYMGEYSPALRKIESTKLEVKVYKTDRALTGKDKTNRAKRWEVLFGDFQFATLQNCWSVERQLTEQLVNFANFPAEIKNMFQQEGLITGAEEATRCPITLAPLDFIPFAIATVTATHGRSDYQIGHLTPLKRGGRHVGANVAWQSADGNRIQGDLTLEETLSLLDTISARRQPSGA